MNNISDISNRYNTYNNVNTDKKTNNKGVTTAAKADGTKTNGTDKYNTAKLSTKAQALFDSLKEKYKDYDLYVADYRNNDEAGEVLSQSTKDFAVVFTSSELEKMAADDEYEAKIEKLINDSHDSIKELYKKIEEGDAETNGVKSADIERLGMSFDADGNVSYFADLLKSSEAQTKSINDTAEDIRKEKAEEKKEEAKKAEKAEEAKEALKKMTEKRVRVSASSIDELLEKFKNFDWSTVKETPVKGAGSFIDYSV